MAFTNNFDGPSVEDGTQSFGITRLKGVFETAAYGGPALGGPAVQSALNIKLEGPK